MDSEQAVIIGTLVGGLCGIGGSIATTWLGEHLRHKKSNRLAEIRKTRLRRSLSVEKYRWRNLGRLCDEIGADEETTIGLLLEIGARRSTKEKAVWGLETRNPFPEDGGMSRALLKLSGGSVHDYATISDDSPSPSRASRARRAATSAGIS